MVHYRIHKRLPPVSILDQPNPVHIPTSQLLEIRPNIIHPSTPRSLQWSLSLRSPTKMLYTPSPHSYTPHAQPISFFSILSPAQYWVRSTNHLASRYAFHRTQSFISAFTSVRHLTLSWASPIQSIYPHPTSWRSVLILSTHLRLGLPSGPFPSGFPTKTLYTLLSSPIRATCPSHRKL